MTHNQWGYPPPPPNYNLYYGAQQPPPWFQAPQSKRGVKKALGEYKAIVQWLEEMKKGGDKDKKEEKKDDKKKFLAILAVIWFISPWLILAYAKLFLWVFSLH